MKITVLPHINVRIAEIPHCTHIWCMWTNIQTCNEVSVLQNLRTDVEFNFYHNIWQFGSIKKYLQASVTSCPRAIFFAPTVLIPSFLSSSCHAGLQVPHSVLLAFYISFSHIRSDPTLSMSLCMCVCPNIVSSTNSLEFHQNLMSATFTSSNF